MSLQHSLRKRTHSKWPLDREETIRASLPPRLSLELADDGAPHCKYLMELALCEIGGLAEATTSSSIGRKETRARSKVESS